MASNGVNQREKAGHIRLDEHFLTAIAKGTEARQQILSMERATDGRLLTYFAAQLESRHLDFAARWLQGAGHGYYTISSAGHEANAAIALALRPSDPALLHYRSGGFYAARALQAGYRHGVEDVLDGMAALRREQGSGGRHKVFGNKRLNIIPQTSTIGSHLPRAVGLAFALRRRDRPPHAAWPKDAVVVTSFGDASMNHSTLVGALNAGSYMLERGAALPLLAICEDNDIGISTRTPAGWVQKCLSSQPGFRYEELVGTDVSSLFGCIDDVVTTVRESGRPAILRLRVPRFLGHAGSDVELGYRSAAEIARDYPRDPIVATAYHLIEQGILTPDQVIEQYERTRERVMGAARALIGEPNLSSRSRVMAPLAFSDDLEPSQVSSTGPVSIERLTVTASSGLTLAQATNAALKELMEERPETIVLGEDVGRKGGVYGITRGLLKCFGASRVMDTLLDEQTILGTSLGLALQGYLPLPEIQYLAYLHNAEDQIRGEAASLKFFSNGQYRNGMVVRLAGLAYQKGFGGHFHNDNSLAVLRDIPGIALAVTSSPTTAGSLYRKAIDMASKDGRVCVIVEPIALYHSRGLLTKSPAAGSRTPVVRLRAGDSGLDEVICYGSGADALLVTYGNGVEMSLQARLDLAELGIECTVVDLQWLSPLPMRSLVQIAAKHPVVVVVDECRASGATGHEVVSRLVSGGYPGRLAMVSSADSFVPLGPAADHVLLRKEEITEAVLRTRQETCAPHGAATYTQVPRIDAR